MTPNHILTAFIALVFLAAAWDIIRIFTRSPKPWLTNRQRKR